MGMMVVLLVYNKRYLATETWNYNILTENDWSDESSDAFWEMVTDQLLFAKVIWIVVHLRVPSVK